MNKEWNFPQYSLILGILQPFQLLDWLMGEGKLDGNYYRHHTLQICVKDGPEQLSIGGDRKMMLMNG